MPERPSERGDFLAAMAESSRARVLEARAREPEAALRARVDALAAPPALRFARFDLIAEVKRASPSEGTLRDEPREALVGRARAYARAGAAAVSVLTEPTRFAGSLEHLAAIAEALEVPAMRKDFLVDPYQLLEARAAGAGGALLVLAILDDPTLFEMIALARELGLFLLLEAFDARELARAGRLVAESAARGARGELFIGLNARDLRTLAVDPARLEALAGSFPPGPRRVAESGLADAGDARRVARLGYDLALVGSALMRAGDPAALVAAMLAAGRAARGAEDA